MSGNGPPDLIADAIAAAESPQAVAMKQIQVTISSTGRPAIVAVPADASEAELVELAAWFLASVIPGFRAERQRGAVGRIIVPSGIKVGLP